MKKMIMILTVASLLLFLFLVGCEGEKGPVGIQGEHGKDGGKDKTENLEYQGKVVFQENGKDCGVQVHHITFMMPFNMMVQPIFVF